MRPAGLVLSMRCSSVGLSESIVHNVGFALVQERPMDDDVMTALIGLLEVVWRLTAERPDKPCSLARLSKQSRRPMSVLRRQLTLLVEAGWVELLLDEGGVAGIVQLSAA